MVTRLPIAGTNDLESQCPEVAREWHPDRNGALRPCDVFVTSRRKVWWLGEDCGHAWLASVMGRGFQGNKCLVCAGYQVSIGFNDLASQFPEVAEDWHPTRNGDLQPTEVTWGTSRAVWWQCGVCTYEWKVSIAQRTGRGGTKCKVCQGKQLLTGFNDLETLYPEVAKEWHPTKNGSLTASEVTAKHNPRRWWRCARNPKHEWEVSVAHRTSGSRCPKCSKHVSALETEVFKFLKSVLPEDEVLQSKRVVTAREGRASEIDIFIPTRNICVEFNGTFFHSEYRGKHKYWHRNKRVETQNSGYRLIMVWEDEWNNHKTETEAKLRAEISGVGFRSYTEDEVKIDLDWEYGPTVESQGYKFVEELEPEVRLLDQGKFKVWNSGYAVYRKED